MVLSGLGMALCRALPALQISLARATNSALVMAPGEPGERAGDEEEDGVVPPDDGDPVVAVPPPLHPANRNRTATRHTTHRIPKPPGNPGDHTQRATAKRPGLPIRARCGSRRRGRRASRRCSRPPGADRKSVV